jgi:hypothetical protein
MTTHSNVFTFRYGAIGREQILVFALGNCLASGFSPRNENLNLPVRIKFLRLIFI